MKLMILITVKVADGFEVAQAWRNNGAPGVTVLRGHGIHTLQQHIEKGEIELEPIFFSVAEAMASLLDRLEENVLVFLSIVPKEIVDSLIATSQSILGDLNQPHSGVIFVLDVERAIGVYNHGANKEAS